MLVATSHILGATSHILDAISPPRCHWHHPSPHSIGSHFEAGIITSRKLFDISHGVDMMLGTRFEDHQMPLDANEQ